MKKSISAIITILIFLFTVFFLGEITKAQEESSEPALYEEPAEEGSGEQSEEEGSSEIDEPVFECDNIYSDADGSFELCKQKFLKHRPSNVTIRILQMNDDYVILKFTGTLRRILRLHKHTERYISSYNGAKVILSYKGITEKNAALLDIESEPNPLCGDKEVTDSEYSFCIGDTLSHDNTDISAKIKSIHKDYVRLRVRGSKTADVVVFRDKARGLETKNGDILSVSYEAPAGNFAVKLKTEYKQMGGRDKYKNGDGEYYVRPRSKIIHEVSGIETIVHSFGKNSLRLLFRNADRPYATIGFRKAIVIKGENGAMVKFTFSRISSSRGARLDIKTDKTSILCGDKEGEEGSYDICIGDTVLYTPTGISIKLRKLTGSHIYFNLTGIDGLSGFRIKKEEFKHISDSEGAKLIVFSPYLSNSNGVKIYLGPEEYIPPKTYNIAGTVIDEKGSPVGGASVMIMRLTDEEEMVVVAETKTNSFGIYRMDELDGIDLNADYKIIISSPGRSGTNTVFEFADDEDITFDTVLYYPRTLYFTYKYNTAGESSFGSSAALNEGSGIISTFSDGSGYNFLEGKAAKDVESAFYATVAGEGDVLLMGDKDGQGGISDLGEGELSESSEFTGELDGAGIEALVGHVYAVFDEANDNFALIRMNKIDAIGFPEQKEKESSEDDEAEDETSAESESTESESSSEYDEDSIIDVSEESIPEEDESSSAEALDDMQEEESENEAETEIAEESV